MPNPSQPWLTGIDTIDPTYYMGCGDSTPPVFPTPTTPSVEGSYFLSITASPPESCKRPDGADLKFELFRVSVIQNREIVTISARALLTRFDLSGTFVGTILRFDLDALTNNPSSGLTTVVGAGTAFVQGEQIVGTFSGDIKNISKALHPVTTMCLATDHRLLLTRAQ
jgi:hypothetical protein